jgi:hypothetical protein
MAVEGRRGRVVDGHPGDLGIHIIPAPH